MRSHNLFDLLEVYRLTFEILFEATLQLPLAVADETMRLAKIGGSA
ncbi:hypothetical protein [Methylobacterium gnaphalii]|uniref:Uncharacterized protein n=1 Tax=Methylobacterium gnaphalii TaxID=1010610 RepID=A0A512JIP6_9HYPH|nr:hypothetical protein [Methylobacterium gnaphalii]GEP09830.1 hypothetical protein MGN01_16750 [Methylobacterium gnaphalii]GJD67255.1 hypothetical protein MMMDOFMJ_0169 [Methylobacterium gnaphalii]GLS49860.1 hypothetical protein GCM10007885_27120 [Methylobacterium gnaphalii]